MVQLKIVNQTSFQSLITMVITYLHLVGACRIQIILHMHSKI